LGLDSRLVWKTHSELLRETKSEPK
jgi:hypothetical protein